MIKMIDLPFSDNSKLDELSYLFFVEEGRKKEALSEIAMTEKPKMDQLRMMLQVGRDYFRHAAPLTGLASGSGSVKSPWMEWNYGFSSALYRCKVNN